MLAKKAAKEIQRTEESNWQAKKFKQDRILWKKKSNNDIDLKIRDSPIAKVRVLLAFLDWDSSLATLGGSVWLLLCYFSPYNDKYAKKNIQNSKVVLLIFVSVFLQTIFTVKKIVSAVSWRNKFLKL